MMLYTSFNVIVIASSENFGTYVAKLVMKSFESDSIEISSYLNPSTRIDELESTVKALPDSKSPILVPPNVISSTSRF